MALPATVNPYQGGGRGVDVGVPCGRPSAQPAWFWGCCCSGTVPRVGPVCPGELPGGLQGPDHYGLHCVPSPQIHLLKS